VSHKVSSKPLAGFFLAGFFFSGEAFTGLSGTVFTSVGSMFWVFSIGDVSPCSKRGTCSKQNKMHERWIAATLPCEKNTDILLDNVFYW
jgi:hypothetical protein